MNENKIIAIFACHTTCIKKYITTLNNLHNLNDNIDKFIIIDSIDQIFALKLKDDLKNNKKLLHHHLVKNDVYFDFGKWINILSIEDLKDYKNILLINDSILLTKNIDRYFLNYKHIDININLYAYNDSSQLGIYHYQSYLFMIKNKIKDKLVDFFNKRKHLIVSEKTLIQQMELNLTKLDPEHDCFIKIANEFNKNKNIFWENESLYEHLIKTKMFHMFKLKKINDHFKHFQYNIQNYIQHFDKNYYSLKYNNLSNIPDLKQHYIKNGFNEGRLGFEHSYNIIPKYCKDIFDELEVTSFFDIPKNFDLYFYKNNNISLNNFTNKKCFDHFFDYGNDDNTLFSENMDDIYSWNK